MTEKLTDALYEETLARVADGHIDLGGTIGLRRWCDGSGPCAVETEPHGHWRGGVSVSTREVVLRLVRERDEARAALAKLRDDVQNACDPECYGCGAWYVAKDAPTIIERHRDNCASHAGHACTCTYAPSIPSLGVVAWKPTSDWQMPASMVPPPDSFTRQQVEAMLRVALTDRTDEWTIKSIDERVSILLSMFAKEKP